LDFDNDTVCALKYHYPLRLGVFGVLLNSLNSACNPFFERVFDGVGSRTSSVTKGNTWQIFMLLVVKRFACHFSLIIFSKAIGTLSFKIRKKKEKKNEYTFAVLFDYFNLVYHLSS
jgi:hypothetical protein